MASTTLRKNPRSCTLTKTSIKPQMGFPTFMRRYATSLGLALVTCWWYFGPAPRAADKVHEPAPEGFLDEVFDVADRPNLAKHLHLPAQSGSTSVLERTDEDIAERPI